MKRKRLYAIGVILFCVLVMASLGVLNYFQARQHALSSHDRWATRVTARVLSERLSGSQWLEDLFGLKRDEVKRIVFSRPNIVGAYWFDIKTHEFDRWTTLAYDQALSAPDPRLVITQLSASTKHATQLGPMLLINGTLFDTAACPIDDRHALVVVQRAEEINRILVDESEWTLLHVYLYDAQGHPLFLGGDLSAIKPALSNTLSRAQSGEKAGSLRLSRHFAWQWVATFHKTPSVDGIFILSEPVPWVYMPVILFFLSFLSLLWLAGLPWKASDALRRAREAADLKQFALRVDSFVRGKDVMLNEPPYPFSELTPIVQSLRWLMPLWKKAESYPKEFGLERKLLSLLIESLPEGILFFNAQGALQLGNELGKVFLGLQQEMGKEYKMVSGIQVPRGFLEPFAEPVFTAQQKNIGKEVEVAWADGKHLYRVWAECVEVDDVAQGYIVVIRDITFRKQWEYVQEQVLSGITHDLRGPLSAIMGYLDLLKRQLKEAPPKAQEYLMLAREAGTRLTQMISDILDVVRFEQGKIEMQVQAIVEAAIEVAKSAEAPKLEIMHPLVSKGEEMDYLRALTDRIAKAVMAQAGVTLDYQVGTMIELPRAAIRAGDLAKSAEFFSFGTNDLTQTTFGISRDDSGRFLGAYIDKGIFEKDPFVSLDQDGVGDLIRIAVERGRAQRPGMKMGICGEHGGDPASIAFCESVGLDYVSCSPYRTPIARLAAAQATLAAGEAKD